MNKEFDKDLLKIINHYGIMPQLKYFQSEVFELNEAIIKKETEYCFGETTKKIDENNISHIAEEMVDVMVMLCQFKEYYKIDGRDILNIMDYKIKRQLDRIEKKEV